jgi:hypothetical protein
VSRGALRPGLGGAELARDHRARQAGGGGAASRQNRVGTRRARNSREPQRGAPLDLESPPAKCARHLPRPLSRAVTASSTVFGLYAARTRSVPPSGPVSYGAVASGGTNSHAELARGISAPSGPECRSTVAYRGGSPRRPSARRSLSWPTGDPRARRCELPRFGSDTQSTPESPASALSRGG